MKEYIDLRPNLNPLDEFRGIDPPADLPPVTYINVHGRKEHEAILKDAKKCEELGVDQFYETMVYLKRWGGWLKDGES
jgi:hypothetical protein